MFIIFPYNSFNFCKVNNDVPSFCLILLTYVFKEPSFSSVDFICFSISLIFALVFHFFPSACFDFILLFLHCLLLHFLRWMLRLFLCFSVLFSFLCWFFTVYIFSCFPGSYFRDLKKNSVSSLYTPLSTSDSRCVEVSTHQVTLQFSVDTNLMSYNSIQF